MRPIQDAPIVGKPLVQGGLEVFVAHAEEIALATERLETRLHLLLEGETLSRRCSWLALPQCLHAAHRTQDGPVIGEALIRSGLEVVVPHPVKAC